MSSNDLRRVFNEYGRFHHNEFYADLKTVQVMMHGQVYINMYTNAEGTAFAVDNNGNPVNNRLLKYTIYNNPYYDTNTGTNVDGVFKIEFLDGTFFKTNDAEDETHVVYWYSFPAITPTVIKAFT
jgi:hypothetical protein